ncbi:MAG: ROK family protein [Parachlamydiales bacterium]|nr:ROK family protein [Parachlamydiales bacterium]
MSNLAITPQSFSPQSIKPIVKTVSKETILCCEIGHSTFQCSVYTHPVTLKDIKESKIIKGSITPWLKNNLHEFFKKSDTNPISSLLGNFSKLSLSIFGPIINSEHFLAEHQGLPRHLKSVLEKETQKEVLIEGDAVNYANGALLYLNQQNYDLKFPLVCVTIGWGTGYAVALDPENIFAVEMWAENFLYEKLSGYVTTTKLGSPRQLLERRYLCDLFGGEEDFDKKMHEHAPLYSRQFEAFMDDSCRYIERTYNIDRINQILVGGQYSKYLDYSKLGYGFNFLLLPEELKKTGLDLDSIQMMGCIRNTHDPKIHSKTLTPSKQMEWVRDIWVKVDLENHVQNLYKLFNFSEKIHFEQNHGKSVDAPVTVWSENGVSLVFTLEKNFEDSQINWLDYLPTLVQNANGEFVTKLGRNYYTCTYLSISPVTQRITSSHNNHDGSISQEILRRFDYYFGSCGDPRKPVEDIVLDKKFIDDPTKHLINCMIIRGPNRCCTDDWIIYYVMDYISDFSKKACSTDYLVELAKDRFKDEADKNTMLKYFEESVNTDDFQKRLKKNKELIDAAIKKGNFLDLDEPEHELRNLYQVFNTSRYFKHYKYALAQV